MKITLAVLADYANITREGKLNIMGIFDVVHSKSFPMAHPQMQLVMRFEFGGAEAGETKKIGIQLMDADGKKLFVLGGDITLGPGRSGEVTRTNHILTMNMMKFEKPGDYIFNIHAGDELQAQVPLKVIHFPESK